MRQPYPTYNRRNLLYADMDRCLTGLFREEGFGDNQDSLSFYRRGIEAGIETQLTPHRAADHRTALPQGDSGGGSLPSAGH